MAFLLIIISWLFLLSLVLGLCRAARLGEPLEARGQSLDSYLNEIARRTR
jgi:hypothetical protein